MVAVLAEGPPLDLLLATTPGLTLRPRHPPWSASSATPGSGSDGPPDRPGLLAVRRATRLDPAADLS